MFQSSSCCGRAGEGKWWLLIKWLSNCVLPLAYCSRFIHVDVDWAQCIVRFGSAFVREIYRKIWWSMFCKNCGVYAYGGGRVVESKYKRPACTSCDGIRVRSTCIFSVCHLKLVLLHVMILTQLPEAEGWLIFCHFRPVSAVAPV